MLIASHGDGAEAHAEEKLREAEACDYEGAAIVWQGVLIQLAKIRAGA